MPVFTSAPATLRARRASRTPTSPVNPDTPDTAARPTSPPVPLESESLVLKAKRAYERDRQRTKKRKERADRERERERSASESHAPPEPRHAREGSGRRARPPRMTIGVPVEVGVDAKDKETLLLSPAVEEIIADIVEREAQARGELEVHIEQLVKPGKARKSKGESVLVLIPWVCIDLDAWNAAGEFELVPSMPVVIALDEMPEDAELDEPWEHISADELDEKRVRPPSYATVVANAL
ncbi:hypothetical protein C8Q76DRAFT_727758 [Earliella scabrosa]|nr:hypothetical protein C8Q76DRAFT_727758 [Earliella scabrosa]